MTDNSPAAGELKFPDEAYQLLIRYEASRGQAVSMHISWYINSRN